MDYKRRIMMCVCGAEDLPLQHIIFYIILNIFLWKSITSCYCDCEAITLKFYYYVIVKQYSCFIIV